MRRNGWSLAIGVLVGLLSIVLPTSPTTAKGPMPVIGEPERPMVVGEPSMIPISMEGPGANDPANPDLYGDDVPWVVYVQPGQPDSFVPEPLAFRRVGPNRYEVVFTPPYQGEWRFNLGTRGTMIPGMDRTLTAGSPQHSRMAVWLILTLVAFAVVLTGGVVLARKRSRGKTYESTGFNSRLSNALFSADTRLS